jgi:filamentous hemagglutinin family protein
MRLSRPVVIAVVLVVVIVGTYLTAMLPSTVYGQAAPKAVTTRIVETTRLPHDLGTRTTQVTEPTTNVTTTSITGGTRPGAGPNLFHSFDFFTVGSKDIAHFLNDQQLPTTNIIARVIGDALGLREASMIDGILRTNNPLSAADPVNFGNANLYLVNPAGIIFGQNAQLDLKGSFAATTADYLRMSDGGIFHTDPVQPSVLTVASVNAFGFTNPRPVAISVQGNINEATLVVSTGQTLSLIGGDINIVGFDNGSSTATSTTLSVPSGRVNLASVASPGEVVPNAEGDPPNLDVGSFQQLGTVNIGPDALVNVEGDPGGTILVRGGDFILNQSGLRASTNGQVNHGGTAIDVEVSGSVKLIGGALAGAEFGASTFGPGNAGNVRIVADTLELVGVPALNVNANIGSRSFSTTADSGDGGLIDITANHVLLRDQAFINTFTQGGGNAGSINLRAGRLELLGGSVLNQSAAFLGTNTFGSGNAGSLEVIAETVRMVGGQGFTGLTSQVSTGGTGNASTLRVTADTVEVLNGAQISSGIFTGSGRGGDIEITANTLLISGLDPRGFSAGLFSSVNFPAPGVAGNIRVTTTGDLTISNGGQINSFSNSFGNSGHIDVRARNLYLTDDGGIFSSNLGAGLGGNVTIEADNVTLSGPGTLRRFHGIFANGGFSAQRAGNISITTENLEVLDGALISARTAGIGTAGNIEITAGRLLIAGADPNSPSAPFEGIESGIVASALALQPRPDLATGDGGSINLNVGTIELRDQGKIQARTTGAGDAGTIQIKTDTLSISSGATISADSTGTGDAGGISIDAGAVNITGIATSSDPFGVDLTGLSSKTVTGTGGTLMVAADNLAVTDHGTLTSSTTGTGDAGTITLSLNTLTLLNDSQITSSSTGTGTGMGAAGTITIEGASGTGSSVDVVSIALSSVLTSAAGDGDGGSILVRAGEINLDGATVSATANSGNAGSIDLITTGLSTFTATNSTVSTEAVTGAGGSIAISSPSTIDVKDSQISASVTGGEQPGGSISLTAPTVTISGGGRTGGGAVEAVTRGAGPGGNITVDTERLSLVDDSDINVSSFGAGRGGTITVNATESVVLFDGALESIANGSGEAGQITVTTPSLTMTEASTDPTVASYIRTIANGSGNAGNITLNVGTAILLDSDIQASTGTGTIARGGSIVIQGLGGPGTTAGRLEVSGPNEAAFISASTFGNGNAGSLDISVDAVTLRGGGPQFVGLATQVGSQAPASSTANGGNLRVSANTLEVLNGAQISAGVFAGSGRGGDVEVSADSILISGRTTGGNPGGIFAPLNFPSTGTAGNIRVTTTGDLTLSNFGQISVFSGSFGNAGGIDLNVGGNLAVTNGAFITSSNFGAGAAGDVNVTAKNIILQGPTAPALAFTTPGIFTIGGVQATRAGNLTIHTGNLDILDGAMMIARTNGPGLGGTIDITADQITISGSDSNLFMPEGTASGIYAGTRILDPTVPIFVQLATGNAGNINVRSGSMDLSNRGTIEALSDSAGNAGNVNLTANSLTMNGRAEVTTEARRQGDAGSVTLNVDTLTAQGDSQITSSSIGTGTGRGDAGNVTVQGVGGAGTATTSVTLDNSDVLTSVAADGLGGNVQIMADAVEVRNLARIAGETFGKGKAGSVSIIGTSLDVKSGGRIEASTAGEGNGGSIAITTTGDISVSGMSSDGQVRSGLFAKTQTTGGTAGAGSGGGGGGGGGQAPVAGKAGDIEITAKNLLLDGGAQIDSSTTSGGAGGNVSIRTAENITVAGSGTRLTSDAPRGDGQGGSLTLVAKNITVRDSGSVTAATGGKGDAGNVTLTALDQVLLQSTGTVTTSTSGSGKGGTIVIQANRVLLDGPGTSITADTLHPFADMTITINILHPNDGDLVVQIDSPTGTRVALLSRVGGTGDNFTNTSFTDQATKVITSASAPFTDTFTPREPLAQLIDELVAGNWTLNVRDQAAGNVGSLESWTLKIGSQEFHSTGSSSVIPDNGTLRSTITVANPTLPVVQGTGEASGIGGDVTVTAGTVTVQNGATMSAASRGSGKGGIVTVNATGPVVLSGPGCVLCTNAEASGAGGAVNVAASRVTLDNGATVTAKSSGAGDAGTITINAGKEFLSANGSLTTESLQASGGNITLLATDMVHLKNSQISASVQGGPNTTGGNILIDPQFVILQNSQIIAQAFQGQGGNISIVANTFLSDASSLVSASSQFGLSGTVNISSPTQALSGALVPLKQNYLSGAMLLNQRCAARTAEGQVSTFIVTEHEGLPQEPGGLLSSLSIEHDGGVSFESVEQVLMASVRPSFFTPMSYEQRIWTDESCRR